MYRNITVYNVNLNGFDISTVDSKFVQLVAGSCNVNCFKLVCHACHFVACKAYWGGQNYTTVQADMANWNIDGSGCIFTSCESQESVSSSYYITGMNHQFVGCRADDSGDLGYQNGLANFGGTVIAGFYLDGGATASKASNNCFQGCHIGLALDKPFANGGGNTWGSFMTAIIYMVGNADWNQGTFYSQHANNADGVNAYSVSANAAGQGAYAGVTATITDANAGGVLNNKFTLDGVAVT
jgi:hypothetical protein